MLRLRISGSAAGQKGQRKMTWIVLVLIALIIAKYLADDYIDKDIVADFINISKEIGINFEITEEFEYEQARFIEETEQDKTASYTADVSDEIPNVYSRVDDTKKADMPAI